MKKKSMESGPEAPPGAEAGVNDATTPTAAATPPEHDKSLMPVFVVVVPMLLLILYGMLAD